MAIQPTNRQEPFDVVALTEKVLKTIDDTAKAVVIKAQDRKNPEDVENIAKRLGYKADNENEKPTKSKLEKASKIEDYYKKLAPYQRKLAEYTLEGNEYLEEIKVNTSFMTKMNELFKKWLPIIGDNTKKGSEQTDKLYRLSKIQDRNRADERMKNWWSEQSFQEKNTLRLQDMGGKIKDNLEDKGGAYKVGVEVATGAASLFNWIGGKSGEGLLKVLGKIGINPSMGEGSLTSKGGVIGAAWAVIRVMARFLGGFSLIAIPVIAIAESLYNHTELFGEYMEAFGKLWTEALGPAFKKMGEWASNVMSYFGGGEGSGIMDTIGYVLNKLIIYFIGEVLPDVFNIIGIAIQTAIDVIGTIVGGVTEIITMVTNTVTSLVNNVLGLFGIGPNKDKSIFELIGGIIKDVFLLVVNPLAWVAVIGKTIYNIAWDLMGGIFDFLGLIGEDILRSFGFTDLTELDKWILGWVGKIIGGYYSILTDMYTKLKNALSGAFESLGTWMSQWDIGKVIVDKVKDIFSSIGNALPSIADIKNYIKGIAKEYLPASLVNGMFGKDPDPVVTSKDEMTSPAKTLTDTAKDYYEMGKEGILKLKDDAISGAKNLINPPEEKSFWDRLKTSLVGEEKKKTLYVEATDKLGEVIDASAEKINEVLDSDLVKNTRKLAYEYGRRTSDAATTYIIAPASNYINNSSTVNQTSRQGGGRVDTAPSLNPHEQNLYRHR